MPLVKLPNDEAEAHPEQRDVEGQDQPGDAGRAGEQLLANAGDCRINEIEYRRGDEEPDQQQGNTGAVT